MAASKGRSAARGLDVSSWSRAAMFIFVASALPSVTRAGGSPTRFLAGCDIPRPVFIMHGLQGNSQSTSTFARWVRNRYPGTKTFQIPLYEDEASMTPLYKQVPVLARYIRNTVAQDPGTFQNGYHLVGYSQGGLLARAVVQEMDDHNVHTLVAMASPQMGAYGQKFRDQANKYLQDAGFGWLLGFLSLMTGRPAELDFLVYERMLQQSLSAVNLWNDPTRRAEYLRGNLFLPIYNGLTSDTAGNQRRKANFLRLKKAVFVSGEGNSDGTLEPGQSGVFGFYKVGSTTEIVPMEDIEEYETDSFGLKTMSEQGKLSVQMAGRLGHGAWVSDFNTVDRHVLPHLECAPDPTTVVVSTSTTTTTSATTTRAASTITTTTTATTTTAIATTTTITTTDVVEASTGAPSRRPATPVVSTTATGIFSTASPSAPRTSSTALRTAVSTTSTAIAVDTTSKDSSSFRTSKAPATTTVTTTILFEVPIGGSVSACVWPGLLILLRIAM